MTVAVLASTRDQTAEVAQPMAVAPRADAQRVAKAAQLIGAAPQGAAASTSTADVAEASSIGGLPRQCMLLESAYRSTSRSRQGRRRHWRRGRWRSRMRGTWSWLQLQSYAAPGVHPIKHACNRPPSAPCPPCALPSACSSAGVGQKARHPA